MDKVVKAHKIRLNPTAEQDEYLRRAAGTKRFVYNWGLAEWKRQYQAYKEGKQPKPPNALDLKKQFNAIREEQFPWTYDVTKCVIEGAFDDLEKAFKNFFAGRAKYPQFKKKGKSRESFYLANDKFELGDHRVQVPVLGDFTVKQREAAGAPITERAKLKKRLGWVNMAESLRFVHEHTPTAHEKRHHTKKLIVTPHLKIVGATIGKEGAWWSLSVQVEVTQQVTPVTGTPVGIDVGISHLATLSDGVVFDNPRSLRRLLGRLKRLQKKLARHKKGSKNRQKTKEKIARLHHRIARMRDDTHHKLAFYVAEHHTFIGLEDLNVKGLLKNHKLALSVSDASLGKLRQYIITKAGRHGTLVQLVGRWFPSTKRCHQCGHEREITLAERTYICTNPACGWIGDRDLNAAINIREEAMRLAERRA